MKVISPANSTVLQMLAGFKKQGANYRKLKYLVEAEVDDGILLFNLLTRELVLLSKEEFENATENELLRNQWFIVPEECDEKSYVDLLKSLIRGKKQKFKKITGYTIFTTTDCNARCFYCFEAGRSRTPMSHETSIKVVKYIKDHCAGKKVTIRWFGGEPLMNQDAIDTICKGLRDEGITFNSSMVTNGYLFNEDAAKKAVELWNLKEVQITLDGTEKVYNKVKAYVNAEDNPFEIVINNIQRLLDTNTLLTIRLNMDVYNASDLLSLTQYLCNKFAGYNNLFIYAHHLFDLNTSNAELHSEQEWKLRNEAMARIEAVIDQHNFTRVNSISTKFKTYHCMADSGRSVTILPDGNIGLCEHYSDSEYIGHIDSEHFDEHVVKSWGETTKEIPECTNCFYYPECIMLKKCSTLGKCYPQHIISTYTKTQQMMIYTYKKNN
ncbi:MAG: 4Fe-4S cluster-binding domain-containing protein [Oscillospiraceae bacterium]|nr:4Fe-4S cluster-binding domain-containing protein [Oscillospiraceae bacterium]